MNAYEISIAVEMSVGAAAFPAMAAWTVIFVSRFTPQFPQDSFETLIGSPVIDLGRFREESHLPHYGASVLSPAPRQ